MIDELACERVAALVAAVLRHSRLDVCSTCVLSPGTPSGIVVEFEGPDAPALLHHHGELLLALEHIATQALRLTPEQHELVSFDAQGFKAARARALQCAASDAVQKVRASGLAHHFAPMSSRERRLLHLALASSGLTTASEGDPPRRHLVLHPAAASHQPASLRSTPTKPVDHKKYAGF